MLSRNTINIAAKQTSNDTHCTVFYTLLRNLNSQRFSNAYITSHKKCVQNLNQKVSRDKTTWEKLGVNWRMLPQSILEKQDITVVDSIGGVQSKVQWWAFVQTIIVLQVI